MIQHVVIYFGQRKSSRVLSRDKEQKMTAQDSGHVSVGAKAIAGTWVQIHLEVLEAGNRLSQVPPETQAVALEMRVRGIALHEAALGEPMQIRTTAGRVLRGTLVDLAPRYDHDFGAGVPELVLAGLELAQRRQKAVT
jgi:hypothetical protein